MKEARRKAEQMELYLEEMVRTYDDIMAFYGEDPSDENARRDFFAKLALFVSEWKKSRDKNVQLEETPQAQRSVDEAQARPAQAHRRQRGQARRPAPALPVLWTVCWRSCRAAAPQVRDQRDRRRRARLKDRHQVRIASGQKIPDLNEIPEMEGGLPTSRSTGSGPTDDDGNLLSPDLASPKEGDEDDVAQRAALLLQGMRGDVDGADEGDAEKRESLRKSRRQTADEERRMRRRRREKAQSGASNGDEGGALEAPMFLQHPAQKSSPPPLPPQQPVPATKTATQSEAPARSTCGN